MRSDRADRIEDGREAGARPRPDAAPPPGGAAVLSYYRPRNDNVPAPLRAEDESRAVAAPHRRQRVPAALLVVSVAIHGLLLAMLVRDPKVLPSLETPAISVELVLGAESAAGASATPSPTESASAPVEVQAPDPEPQTTPADSPAPQIAANDLPVAEPTVPPAAEAAPAPPRDGAPEPPAEAASAPSAPEKPVSAAVEPLAVASPAPEPAAPKEPPTQAVSAPAVAAPAPPKPAKPARRDTARQARLEPDRPAPPAPRAAPASSVGRGRSNADAAYAAQVAAHLARYKRFPADVQNREAAGVALVQFSVDGSGRVTSVRLARGTGVSALDQEAQALVRRASPVPPPPSGEAISFTLPINFQMR